jgi:Rrf2 family protein
MKLTRSVSYAVGILLQVADESDTAPMTAARIAHGCRFPPRFLYRILRRLVDADLLGGTSGPGGGYRLSRSPRNITLLDIVSAVDAPPEATRLVPVRTSHRDAMTVINELCETSAQHFAADLKQIKLSKLQAATKRKPAKKSARKAKSSRAAKNPKRPGSRGK